MARYKQRRQNLRARAKLLMKKTRPVVPSHSSTATVAKPLVSWSFGSWPSAWSSIRVMKPLVSTALSLFMWCQSRITQNGIVTGVLPEKQSCHQSETLTLATSAHKPLDFVEQRPLSSQGLVPPAPPAPPLPAPGYSNRTNSTNTQAASLKKDVSMQITLKELLNVKLKKRQSSLGIDKKASPLQKHRALITVSDLQSIHLRSNSTRPPIRTTHHLITPNKSHLDFRKHLKRVAIQRSPGGTPVSNKENMETGTGLTPIVTQALRRKFQLAHPKSPSPTPLPRGSSFDEQ